MRSRGNMKKALLIPVILTLLVPVAAWALYKPVRVVAPDWVENVSCVTTEICLDDESKHPEASRLYEESLYFVALTTGFFKKPPRIIFCSTEKCFQSFGFNKASAGTVGRWGIVISPRGWKDYYVRHEMIHHRQAEELGMLAVLQTPEWFIEGMAYSLSADPRQPLSEPWRSHRAQFNAWLRKAGRDRLWKEAREL